MYDPGLELLTQRDKAKGIGVANGSAGKSSGTTKNRTEMSCSLDSDSSHACVVRWSTDMIGYVGRSCVTQVIETTSGRGGAVMIHGDPYCAGTPTLPFDVAPWYGRCLVS